MVVDVVQLVHLDLALPPTRPIHPLDLLDLGGLDHQHPGRPIPARPLVAQLPLSLGPVEEVSLSSALASTRGGNGHHPLEGESLREDVQVRIDAVDPSSNPELEGAIASHLGGKELQLWMNGVLQNFAVNHNSCHSCAWLECDTSAHPRLGEEDRQLLLRLDPRLVLVVIPTKHHPHPRLCYRPCHVLHRREPLPLLIHDLEEGEEGASVCSEGFQEDRAADGDLARQVLQVQGCFRLPGCDGDVRAARGIGELQHLVSQNVRSDNNFSNVLF